MSKKNTSETEIIASDNSQGVLGHCGVIMPISNTDGYVSGHWQQVLNLVKKAAVKARFSCEMVSDNTFSNVMHANIITNIFTNELVVCDVSSLNSNVMLELGLRLASKKPVVIIYDGEGAYPFDMNQLFYVKYDKGLRYYETEDFIKRLSERITNTYLSTKPDSSSPYKPYLNYFTDIQIEASDINRETVGLKEAVELLTKEVAGIRSSQELGISKSKYEHVTIMPPKVYGGGLSTSLNRTNDMRDIIRDVVDFIKTDYSGPDSYIARLAKIDHLERENFIKDIVLVDYFSTPNQLIIDQKYIYGSLSELEKYLVKKSVLDRLNFPSEK